MTDQKEHLGLAVARGMLEAAAADYEGRGGLVADEQAVLDAALTYGRVLRNVRLLKAVEQEIREAEAKAPVAVIIDGQRIPIGEGASAANGAEVIFVFVKDDAPPAFTSYVGDPCWDTPENRRRTFEYIKRAEELERQKETT
jgi:hypothetical protein